MDLMRGSVAKKSVPEPIWPRSGRVADQIKVFNERYSPNGRSSASVSTTVEIIGTDSDTRTSANSATLASTSIVSPATVALAVSANQVTVSTKIDATSNRSHLFEAWRESGNARTKSGIRRLTGQFPRTREMSPIGECPSFDETEDERKTPPCHNDSIVTEALLRMTGENTKLKTAILFFASIFGLS